MTKTVKLIVEVEVRRDWAETTKKRLYELFNSLSDTSYRGFGFKPPVKDIVITVLKEEEND